jgi:hypothetical protein
MQWRLQVFSAGLRVRGAGTWFLKGEGEKESDGLPKCPAKASQCPALMLVIFH